MTDIRRVTLSSVPPTEKETKVKKESLTFRFVLSLGESNSTSCPEYSFTDLVKTEKSKQPANDDPFDDNRNNDADVVRIAQQFEEKYGNKSFKSSGKKRTQDMDDYYDLGEGYDTEDSFIDNTEAYDEVIPSTLTTKYGGFYINQGKLDFRSISDDSTDSNAFQGQEKKKKKERAIIESDSEEETGEALRKKYQALKRKRLLEREDEKKKKKLVKGINGEVVKKKKKKNLDLHKQKNALIIKTAKEPKAVPQSSHGNNPSVKPPVPSTTVMSVVSPSRSDVSSVVATTPTAIITTSVTTAPISNASNHEGNKVPPALEDPAAVKNIYSSILEEAMKDESSSKSGDEEKKEDDQSEEKTTQLPSQLPPELVESIEVMKKAARERKEGKSKFFTAHINKLLLSIEMASLKLSKSHRSAIFNHLSEHLPSGKNTLLRRAKKLRAEGPLERLKAAISKMMPALEEQHEKAVARLKLESQTELSETAKEEASTESEEEEGKSETKKVIRRRARRKFEWTPEIRELYLNVVQSKMKSFDASKAKNITSEDYLKSYLESEIKPLWPPGWMNTRLLYKITRTSQEESVKGSKPKKTPAGKTSPVPETSNPQHVSRVEDVIEISSILDDDIEEKKNVVVNLFDKPPASPNQYSQQSISVLVGSSNVPPLKLPHAQTNPAALSQATSACPSLSLNDFSASTGVVGSKLSEKGATKPGNISNSVQRAPSPDVEIIDSQSPIGKKGVFPSNSVPSSLQHGVSPKVVSSSMSPQSTSTPKGALGSNLTSSFSTLTSNSSQSFLQAFNKYLNQTQSTNEETITMKRATATTSSPQQHPSSKSPSISSSGFHQTQKRAQAQVQASVHDKVTATSSKTLGITPQAKVSQEYKLAGLPHKGLLSANGQNTPMRSPVVTINRIPTSGLKPSPKQSATLSGNKTSFPQGQKSSVHPQPRFQGQSQNFSAPQHGTALKKKPANATFPVTIMSSSKQGNISGTKSQALATSQLLGTSLSSTTGAATQRKNNSAGTALPASHIKSGIVLGTSLQKLSPQQQQLHRQHLQQQQQRSHITSGVALGSGSTTPLTVRTSPFSPSPKAANKSPSPSTSIIHSASILSTSGTSSPSPQKSPVSPSSSAASLFDRIQSQMRKQEATEEQGLKAIAMALKFDANSTPNPKHLSGQSTGNGSTHSGKR